ncbi:MAG: carboxypeptidase regulatory-like domain-containing protein [Planctomycetota bacterium]
MSRPLIALLLLVSLAATGAVALLLTEGARTGRGDREESDVAPPKRQRQAPPAEGRDETVTPDTTASDIWTLSGHVRDESGRPIPGATVLATVPEQHRKREQEVVTDQQGRYELIELTKSYLVFDVWARGFLPLAGLVNGAPTGENDFIRDGDGPWVKDFVLQRAASLTGRVLDESGAPVKGATVYVLSPEHQIVDHRTVGNVVTANGRGEFVFPGLLPDTYDLGVRTEGFLPGMVRDVAIVGQMPVVRDVVLGRGRRINVTLEPAPPEGQAEVASADSRLRGMLLPPGGVNALAGALVGRAWIDRPVVAGHKRTDGVIVLEGVGPGPADVWVVIAAGYLIEDGLGRLLDTTKEELTLELVPGVLVQVHVRHAVTGEPLQPQIVRRTLGVPGELAVRDLRGLFLVPLDERAHALHFTLEGFQATKLDLPDLRPASRPGRWGWAEYPTPFDVVMMPEAQGETGTFYLVFEPPLDGRVALIGRDAEGRQQWVRHLDDKDVDEGRWEVKTIPVGEYAVSVLASGMIPATLPRVVVTRTLKETHKILLARGGGLSLKVTDTEDRLLDKVHLVLKDAGERQIDIHVLTHVSEGRAFLSVNYLPSAATARADSGLAPGEYTLTVYKEGFLPATEGFVIRGQEVAGVALTLRPR